MDEKTKARLNDEPVCTIGQCSSTIPQGFLTAWMTPCPDEPIMTFMTDECAEAEMPDLRAGGVRRIELSETSEEEEALKELVILSGAGKKKEEPVRAKRKRKPTISESYSPRAISEAAKEASYFATAKETAAPQPVLPKRSILEQYKACDEGTIRRQWADAAEKNELSGSGMPTYMQMIAEGKEDQYDQEMLKYCKLAGLKYVTTKEKMKKEVELIQKDMQNAVALMEIRLKKLVESFKQMDIDA